MEPLELGISSARSRVVFTFSTKFRPESCSLKASTDDYFTELIPNVALVCYLEIVDNKVHLIHQTARGFLLKNHQLRAAKLCSSHDLNIYLAKVCMAYLRFEDFETRPCCDWETLAVRKRQYPLHHYAAHSWHVHI